MSDNRPSWWNSIPPVTKNIIIINFILWLATFIARRWDVDLNSMLGMHYWASDKFNFTQLITYMFMHGGFEHFFFNMFAVFMFGTVLENTWGGKRYLFYYLVTGIGAGLIQQIVYTIELQPALNAINSIVQSGNGDISMYKDVLARYFRFNSETTTIGMGEALRMQQDFMAYVNRFVTVGASGSIFGILLAFGMLFPNTQLYIMFIPIPIKAKYFVIGYGVIELFLGFANRVGDSVAHFAHVGGMLFGILLILYWKKKGRLYS